MKSFRLCTILFLLLQFFHIESNAQEGTKFGFELRNHLATIDENQMVPLLVEGNSLQTSALVYQYGGQVRLQIENLFSIELPANKVYSFSQEQQVKSIEFSLSEGKAMNDTMLIHVNADSVMKQFAPLRASYTGKGVVLGVIDSGIELAHADFKDSTGKTRVLYIWDQSVAYNPSRQANSYTYGVEWDSTSINAGLSTHDDKANEFGHGSNVTGAAASNGLATGNFKGVAPEVNIISVATDFRKPNWLQTVAEAVDYIYTKADSLGMPCVINASIGTYIGSHDGLDISARMIDKMIKAKEGRAFVCAAGNAGNRKFHLRHELNNNTQFTWFENAPAQHAGQGGYYFEVWSDTNDFKNVKFSIGADRNDTTTYEFRGRTDFDSISNRLNRIYRDTVLGKSGKILAEIETYAEESQGRYKLEISIVNPDSSDYLYRFETKGTGSLDIWSDFSLFRHNNIIGDNLPTISQFPEITNYKKPDSLQTMVSSFTCLPSVITVGNYTNRNTYTDVKGRIQNMNRVPGEISTNSSLGPNRKDYLKPDICSAGDIMFAAGRLATIKSQINGNPSKVSEDSLHYRNGGTSMASPTVAGMVALYLEQCPDASFNQIRSDLLKSARQDVFTGTNTSFKWGHGKADAFNYLKQRVFSPKLSPIVLPNLCEGDSIELSVNQTYKAYRWVTGDTLKQTFAKKTDSYFAFTTDSLGCTSPTDTISLTFNSIPDKPTILQVRDSLIVQNTKGSYQWYHDNNIIPAERDSVIKVAIIGDYHCIYTNNNGCSVSTDTVYVSVVSIKESGLKKYNIFPNPTNGNITISWDNESTINNLQLYSLEGKLVWKSTTNKSMQQEDFYFGQLPKGIYYLHMIEDKAVNVEKIILQ